MNNQESRKGRGIRSTEMKVTAPPRVAVSGRAKLSDNEDNEMDIKDKKIASLEEELATMADEFERELTLLSHKMTDEKEAAAFWQQKHATLNQTYLKTDTDLRLLRQETNAFQHTMEERDRDVRLLCT